jgi:hypothetical protein
MSTRNSGLPAPKNYSRIWFGARSRPRCPAAMLLLVRSMRAANHSLRPPIAGGMLRGHPTLGDDADVPTAGRWEE